MKSKKKGLIIIILSSFAIVADAVLFIFDRLGYMAGREQSPLYYLGGIVICAILLLIGIQMYRKGN